MERSLVYVPIFRLKQEEQRVLVRFNFGTDIYPYVEIVKERDVVRTQSSKKKKDGSLPKPPKVKTFEDIHLPIIAAIKSKKVFVDLPVHFLERKGVDPVVIKFMTSVINNRYLRTSFMKKFGVLSDKVIPIISSYHHKTNELDTIVLQESDLRLTFPIIGFRTCITSLKNDISQIVKVARGCDYLLVDLENCEVLATDPEISEMISLLEDFKNCSVLLIRSALDKNMTNKGIEPGKLINNADNSLMNEYRNFGASGFADYAGIKRNDLEDGGIVSPGFVFYDATENNFYGFRGAEKKPKLEDFLDIIVPEVLSSEPANRMGKSGRSYLCDQNKGWSLLNDMQIGKEKSMSQGKFKRVSMEHYLHCVKTKIEAGDFA